MRRFALVPLFVLAACKSAPRDPMPATSAAETTPLVEPAAVLADDAQVGEVDEHAPLLHVLASMAPVFDTVDATVVRGYLRKGASVRGALADLPADDADHTRCAEGWYELRGGGFVCGRWVTLDATDKRVLDAPAPPALDEALPYTYGYATANGTPLYRWIPSRADRLRYEPWLEKKETAAAAVSAAVTSDEETPWYLRDWEGGKPQVSLDELEEGGPIERRMVRGFYVSVDTTATARLGMLATVGGDFAPKDRVAIAKPITDFHGVWLGASSAKAPPWPRPIAQPDGKAPAYAVAAPPTRLPMAFVNGIGSKRWTLDDARAKATESDPIARYTPVAITDRSATIRGVTYLELEGGAWLRASDAVVVRGRTAPADLGADETWIDVDVTTQTLVAHVGTEPVFATMVSTGRWRHETPLGTFHVREKHVTATMKGNGSNGEGPYAIEDVPWIMYFEGGYALHGAFWHSNFGHRQSHGCVNLAPADARALFGWAEPRLPDGWHGRTTREGERTTRVVIHA